jgi:hypothetical protein
MINECGAAGGMRTSKGNQVFRKNLLQFHFFHPKFSMI